MFLGMLYRILAAAFSFRGGVRRRMAATMASEAFLDLTLRRHRSLVRDRPIPASSPAPDDRCRRQLNHCLTILFANHSLRTSFNAADRPNPSAAGNGIGLSPRTGMSRSRMQPDERRRWSPRLERSSLLPPPALGRQRKCSGTVAAPCRGGCDDSVVAMHRGLSAGRYASVNQQRKNSC